ncbi:transcriptional regulator [Pilimelia anulata]|uniref:Transcriptional regulator n=1 Tax=Pilimelia anulata TaxID=53371 RepID=A0A8J3FBA5_9ACTN|nr:helix-turn-helix domain-containing protein [Pilimelia anulata]GGK00810.1 transcriptional regulator [Pilimelia anulata]
MRDPQELRAIAHPVRLQLLDELFLGGPATATELAERLAQSPANCSWHLRQLARYGYVEEAGGGAGRRRPWRAIFRPRRWGGHDESTALAHAGSAVSELLLHRELEQLSQWRAARAAEPTPWRDTGFVNQAIGWLTADELAAVSAEIDEILLRYAGRTAHPAERPEDARPVRFVAWGVPVPAPPQ